MSFCQNCGQQIPDGAPQCPNCGMPLMQQAMNQQPVYQQNPYPNQQQVVPNINTQQQQPKKKGKGCLIAIIIAFVLLFVFPKTNRNNQQSNEGEQSASEKSTLSNQENQNSQETTAFNKDDYAPLDYDVIIHNSNGLKGEKFTCSGRIIQVMTNSYRLSLENGSFDSDIILIDYKLSGEESRIAEDDYVTVWGVSKGLETYTTVLKSEVTVPRLSVDKLERITEEDFSKLKYSKSQILENNLAGSSDDFHITLNSSMLQHTEQNDIIYLFFEFENITDAQQYASACDAYVDGYKIDNKYSSEKINGYNGLSIESIEAGKKYLGYLKYEIPNDWQSLECTIEDVSFTVQRTEFEAE